REFVVELTLSAQVPVVLVQLNVFHPKSISMPSSKFRYCRRVEPLVICRRITALLATESSSWEMLDAGVNVFGAYTLTALPPLAARLMGPSKNRSLLVRSDGDAPTVLKLADVWFSRNWLVLPRLMNLS